MPETPVPPDPFGYDSECELYFAQSEAEGRRVYVADEKRLELYRGGISARLEWLQNDYRIPKNLVRPGDLVVDIGANSGELGIAVSEYGARYVGIEPDPNAFKAMSRNVKGQSLFDVAVSDTEGTSTFYLATSDADSSLFKPLEASSAITVKTVTLDSLLQSNGLTGPIRLLKVEAEGMEPEVLAGASETLMRTDCVAVDAGPERGSDNTVPQVLNALYAHGFSVVDAFLLRGTFFLARNGSEPLARQKS